MVRGSTVSALAWICLLHGAYASAAGKIDETAELAGRITVQVLTSNFDGKRWHTKVGTGTIIDTRGVVATCSHVLGDRYRVRVKLFNGRTLEAKVLGRFPEHDIALLQFKDLGYLEQIPKIHPGIVLPGTQGICLGFPRGKRKICVAKVEGYGQVKDDAKFADGTTLVVFKGNIAPGYSGGPLMDLNAGLIGVVVAQNSSIRTLGYAVSSSVLLEHVEEVQDEIDKSEEASDHAPSEDRGTEGESK